MFIYPTVMKHPLSAKRSARLTGDSSDQVNQSPVPALGCQRLVGERVKLEDEISESSELVEERKVGGRCLTVSGGAGWEGPLRGWAERWGWGGTFQTTEAQIQGPQTDRAATWRDLTEGLRSCDKSGDEGAAQ